MNHRTNSLLASLLGFALCLMAGCSTTRTTSDSAEKNTGRVSGGIAAVAGESARIGSTLTDEDIRHQSNTYAEQLLQGRVAGVEVLERPGGGFSVRIRGKSSILGSSEPLYVVDGMHVMKDARSGLSWLNIHDIKKIEVLKTASATAIYGSRGANGVVLITTKRGPANN